MSTTEQNRTPTAPRGRDVDLTENRVPRQTVRRSAWRETKPSFLTTELWLTIIGVVVLAVIYNAAEDGSLNLFRTCLLGTIMGAAYIVSRGFAKAGSHDDDHADGYDRRS